MRTEGVVFPAVIFDYHTCFGEGPELLPVEAFVTQASMEALHIAVLPWAARINVDRLDLVLREPRLDGLGDELTPIITSQIGRGSMLLDRLAHPFEDITTLEGPIRPQHMALAGILVEDREHPQRPASRGSIADEVPGPDMPLILSLHWQPRRVAAADHLPLGRRDT